jgi:L-rhamnose mutarotase
MVEVVALTEAAGVVDYCTYLHNLTELLIRNLRCPEVG